MAQQNKQKCGFTIVELLIVIVVIGILAAISVAAYSGVRNRANNAAVQADLRNIAMKLREYHALKDVYPRGSTTTSVLADMEPVAVTKAAYANDIHNLYYCRGAVDGMEQFSLVAVSKSGAKYMYNSSGGIGEFTAAIGSSGDACNGTNVPKTSTDFAYSYGLFAGATTWSAWVK